MRNNQSIKVMEKINMPSKCTENPQRLTEHLLNIWLFHNPRQLTT